MEQDNDSPLVKDEPFGWVACYDYNDRIPWGSFGAVYKANITNRDDFSGAEQVPGKVVHLDGQSALLTNFPKWLLIKWLNQIRQNLPEVSHHDLVAWPKITMGEGLVKCVDLGTLNGSLRHQGASLREAEVASYAKQMAEGLQFLHGKQLVHGDLKPSNILTKLSKNDDWKLFIADLNDIVQMGQSVTRAYDITQLRGTYRYISPEMLTKFGTKQEFEIPGRKTSDVWSFGRVVFEVFTGVPKFIRTRVLGNEPPMGTYSDTHGHWPYVESARNKTVIKAENMLQQFGTKSSRLRVALFNVSGDCSRIAVQIFDPFLGIMQQVSVPNDIPSRVTSESFLALGEEVILQAANIKETGIETIAWDIGKQVWRNISSEVPLPAMTNMVVVDNKVYFWDDNDKKFPFKAIAISGGKVGLLEALPKPKRIRNVNCHVRYCDKIIYAGDTSFRTLCSRKLEYFTIRTKKWAKLPNMPDERHGFGMIVLLGSIYFLGGMSSEDEMLRSCMRLNMRTRKWENIGDLLQPRRYHCAFIAHNCIYVYGGLVGREGHLSQTMETYDSERNAWSSVTYASLGIKLDGHGLLMSRAVDIPLR